MDSIPTLLKKIIDKLCCLLNRQSPSVDIVDCDGNTSTVEATPAVILGTSSVKDCNSDDALIEAQAQNLTLSNLLTEAQAQNTNLSSMLLELQTQNLELQTQTAKLDEINTSIQEIDFAGVYDVSSFTSQEDVDYRYVAWVRIDGAGYLAKRVDKATQEVTEFTGPLPIALDLSTLTYL